MDKLKNGWASSEFWSLALSTLVPMALTAMGHAPNPIVAAAGVALSALYAVLRTWLKSKHIDKASVVDAIVKAEAAVEAATGKRLPADLKSAAEFGAGAIVDAVQGAGDAPAPMAK